MENETLIVHQGASLRSIIKKTTIPLLIILMIINILIQVLMTFNYGYELNRVILQVTIFSILSVVLLIIITKFIHDYTKVDVYEQHIEISDMAKSYKRVTTLKYDEIKSVEIIKNALIIETDIKYKILHLVNPYKIEEIIKKKLITNNNK
jgi:hypothetical protein